MAADITEETWRQVAPYLARGITSLDTLASVKQQIEDKEAQLWVTWEGSRCLAGVVTKITAHPRGRVLTICHCGGVEMRSWKHHFDILEAFAREKKCVRIDIIGREGWERELPGFHKTAVVLQKVLK